MSVENTSNNMASGGYGGDTPGGGRAESPDLGTLREAFADAMRLSLSSRVSAGEGSSTDTLLESADDIQGNSADRRNDEDRNQRKRFNEDVGHSATERKSLDRSEIRDAELQNEYVDRLQRRENIRSDFQPKTKTGESISSDTVFEGGGVPVQFVGSSLAADGGIPVSSVSQIASSPAGGTSGTGSVVFPNTPLTISMQAAAAWNAGTGVSIAATQPVSNGSGTIRTDLLGTLPALTIFSLSGRIGAAKDSKESEEEKHGSSEKKKEKKDRFAATGMPGSVWSVVSETESSEGGFHTVEEDTADPARSALVEAGETEPDERTLIDPFGDKEDGKGETDPGSGRRGISFEKTDRGEPEKNGELSPEWKRRIAEAAEEIKRRLSASGTIASAAVENAPASPVPNPIAAAPGSNILEQFDRVRLVQRVAAACESAVNRSGIFRIKVHLDELGPLSIRVSTQSGKMDVRFEATTERASQLLRDEAEVLRETLAERNVILGRVDVELIE